MVGLGYRGFFPEPEKKRESTKYKISYANQDNHQYLYVILSITFNRIEQNIQKKLIVHCYLIKFHQHRD